MSLSLASHAAALAAFKSLGKPSDTSKQSSKRNQKKFTLPDPVPIELKPAYTRQHLRSSSTHSLPRIVTELPRESPNASANSNGSRKSDRTSRNNKSIYDVSNIQISADTGSVHTRSSSVDYFTLPKDSLVSPKTGVRKSNLNHSNLSINKARAQDTINTLKQSLNSKAMAKDPKRISQEYSPQEMLSRVKQSITDKSVTSSGTELTKAKDRINEIRESIDLKRVQTSVKNLAILDDGFLEDPVLSPYLRSNNSSTTVGSSMLYPESAGSMPAIITTTVDGTNIEEPIEPQSEEDPNSEDDWLYPRRNMSAEGLFQRPITPILSHSSTASPLSPIQVPPSLGASAREAALGSSESLHNPGYKYQSFDSAKTTLDESSRSKPKRKPPPGFRDESRTSEIDSKRLSVEPHGYMSRSLVDGGSSISENETGDDNESTTKLPQFPGFDEKSHHHGKHKRGSLLKKRYKLHGGGKIDLSGIDDTITDPLATPSTLSSSRPTTPMLVHQNQPVQLKTTMRKTHKKNTFNEDKPWKHHTDLTYVTESERKRYEGVWASNKGLYMNRIVTKLKGVSYGADNQPTQEKQEEHDASTKAAMLSSLNTIKEKTYLEEFNQLHNLDKAEMDQLMPAPVVKRIWVRSKLPEETLEQIWNLVGCRDDGTLNKQEFLVGMWLIDQCLYGRKLPKKVSTEVWASLESIGLNVVIRKRGKR